MNRNVPAEEQDVGRRGRVGDPGEDRAGMTCRGEAAGGIPAEPSNGIRAGTGEGSGPFPRMTWNGWAGDGVPDSYGGDGTLAAFGLAGDGCREEDDARTPDLPFSPFVLAMSYGDGAHASAAGCFAAGVLVVATQGGTAVFGEVRGALRGRGCRGTA